MRIGAKRSFESVFFTVTVYSCPADWPVTAGPCAHPAKAAATASNRVLRASGVFMASPGWGRTYRLSQPGGAVLTRRRRSAAQHAHLFDLHVVEGIGNAA